jgi:xanthine dehydrogenase accessory factor
MKQLYSSVLSKNRSKNLVKKSSIPIKDLVVAIKGAGEMATGLACRLFKANIKHIFMMDIEKPMAVRRQVSFCEAIHDGTITVEGVTARKAENKYNIQFAWQDNEIPIIVDPLWISINAIQPHVVIDAIIAKKNLGTSCAEAPLVIGLGPGFEAGNDVHLVIETNRGHNLGRVISHGPAEANTGLPGNINGYNKERVLRAPCAGVFTSDLSIGAVVSENDIIGHVDETPVKAQINGMVRGLIRNQTLVKSDLKIGDIDPRSKKEYCPTVSEKARAIGGSILEAILNEYNQ